jgi:hypothetical protein
MAERIGILSLGKFSRVLMLAPMFERIKRQDPDSIILLVCDSTIKDHQKELQKVDKFLSVDECLEQEFDLFINTDFDDLSSAVSSRVKTKNFRGFVCDEYGHKKTDGLWFKYIKHMNEKSFLNMFHYSDIISTASGFPVKEIVAVKFIEPVKDKLTLFSYGPYGSGNKINLDGVEWVSGFDRDGFLEYLPAAPIQMSEDLFYGLVYRSVWKCTVSRAIRAGDPQRFLSFGETYLDRMVDIDTEIDQLYSRVFKKFQSDSIEKLTASQKSFIEAVTKVKELAFEGQKLAKDFLSAASKSVHEIKEIKDIKTQIQNIEKEIDRTKSMNMYVAPLIDFFKTEEPVDDVKNLFPLAKSIILSFEDLFSRASFSEEMINGLCKKIKGENNG